MDTLLHVLVISLMYFLELVDAASIVRDTDTSACQVKLTFEIEQCLQKYEAKYLVYSDQDSSLQLKEAMQPMLCREYESSLQCLHFALKECPATDFHLQMIASRLGHVRSFMATLCEHSKQQSSTTSTFQSSTTTPVPVQDMMDSSGEQNEDQNNVVKKHDYSNIVTQGKHDKSNIATQSIQDYSNTAMQKKQDFVAQQIFKKNMLKRINKGFQNEVVYKPVRHTNKMAEEAEISNFQSLQQNFNDCPNNKNSKCNDATNQATAFHIIDWMLFLCMLCLYTWL